VDFQFLDFLFMLQPPSSRAADVQAARVKPHGFLTSRVLYDQWKGCLAALSCQAIRVTAEFIDGALIVW
jgi:hypothetical protein